MGLVHGLLFSDLQFVLYIPGRMTLDAVLRYVQKHTLCFLFYSTLRWIKHHDDVILLNLVCFCMKFLVFVNSRSNMYTS